MKLSVLLFCLASYVLPSALTAQEVPTPPQQMQRFWTMLGEWEGSGELYLAAGSAPQTWRARASYQRALGGFFLCEDMRIEVADGEAPPMRYRNYFGYDRERGRYLSVGIGPQGVITHDIEWIDEQTMVYALVRSDRGPVATERWMTKIAPRSIQFLGHRAVGMQDFFVHVQGSLQRVEAEVLAEPEVATVLAEDLPAPMQKLLRCCGKYQMSGGWKTMPDAAPVPIAGNEVLRPLFAGQVLESHVHGEVGGALRYEAWSAWSWDEARQCFITAYVNSMGEISASQMRWVEDVLVHTTCQTMQGTPCIIRGQLIMDAQGKLQAARAHAIIGTDAPFEMFAGEYSQG